MRQKKLIAIGNYKIYYESYNYIVRNEAKGKSKEECTASYFTTLLGAINHVSERLVKAKLHSDKISTIDDLKTVIMDHNKFMKNHIEELDALLKNGIE